MSGFFQDLATEHGSDYNYSATSSPCAKRKKQCDEEWDNGSKEWSVFDSFRIRVGSVIINIDEMSLK